MSDFELRPGTAADLPLVYSATARSMHGSPFYRDLPDERWSGFVNDLIDRWSLRGLTIAYPTGFPTEIAGFVLGEAEPKPVVVMLYVKSAYRGLGVSLTLLEAVTRGNPELLCVLGKPSVLGKLQSLGYRAQLSPHL